LLIAFSTLPLPRHAYLANVAQRWLRKICVPIILPVIKTANTVVVGPRFDEGEGE
jgi:hypothetical protein